MRGALCVLFLLCSICRLNSFSYMQIRPRTVIPKASGLLRAKVVLKHNQEFGILQMCERPTKDGAPSTASVTMQNMKNLAMGKGWKGNLSKESIAKLGLNVLLAYGFVSNVSYITCVILAWIGHGRMYGKSPLAAGQWKAFLLIYSGFFAANNVIRPLRFSLSLVLSPFFDAQIVKLRRNLGLSRTAATSLLVFLVNVVGTITYLVAGLMLATKYTGVPLQP